MSKPKPAFYAVLIIFILCFLYGLSRLFGFAFESGELYPPYSTLRTDPLGSKAFYESLNRIQSLEVFRNYASFSKLPEGQNTALVFLGLAHDDLENWPKSLVKSLDRFIQEGGRLVLAFAPQQGFSPDPDEDSEEEKKTQAKEEQEKKSWKEDGKKECSDEDCVTISLADHWGLEVQFAEESKPGEEVQALRSNKSQLPSRISWHTVLFFDKIDKPWKVIYTARNKPVIIEKAYGRGSIMIAADSYLFSNEALRKERSPELLLWFMGPRSKLIFDETHFGIAKSEGVATLVRRFRMQWFIVGFLFMAGLFIWKQMTPLVPPQSRTTHPEFANIAQGRDYTSGLIGLLKSHIPVQTVLYACFQEWAKSRESQQKAGQEKIAEIETLIRSQAIKSKDIDPIRGYQAIHKILSQRRKS
ncbi:MAG: DUF4350 domain-containing protein [Desulfobacteraceae bacterium]|nr:MAG: DUF4350 domain-containing protein [Desulfobacteraceae bacterium]